jgi:anthranilate phosphoribosyltransferase
MLLRFRGEDADEVAGLVEAARTQAGLPWRQLGVALDWPSYGAGRTRGAPWFLLSALALARAGVTVLMHGSNDFTQGMDTGTGLLALGLEPAETAADARRNLQRDRFAYVPLRTLDPALDQLLGMRRLFGLRSPVNTVARLLNPADAPAGVDGVFHPPYIDVHLGVAQRLDRERLIVLKGGGGEAERVPLKPATASLWDSAAGRSELALPAVDGLAPHAAAADTPDLLAAVWLGQAAPETPVAAVKATIALALLALGRSTDPCSAMDAAAAIWAQRR